MKWDDLIIPITNKVQDLSKDLRLWGDKRMNLEDIKNFLYMDEGPTLEFKRDMYAIYSKDPKVPQQQKGELIKDILSLANGSFDTVGQSAILIVGVDEVQDQNGKRVVTGVEGRFPSRDDLLNMIREVSNPPLQDLDTQVVDYEGKKIWVVSIPPSPSVHETKKVLETPRTNHSAHIVFIRRNSQIDNASTNERVALEKLKRINVEQKERISPMIVGAVGGAFTLGIIMGKNTQKITDGKVSNRFGLITGIFVGLFTGGSIGYSLDQFVQIFHDVRKLLLRSRK